MAIPRGVDVDELIRKVPKGRVITQTAIRAELARRYGVDHACPLCTGIFVRIAAEAAEEDAAAGRKRVTPWWRVVRDNGALLEKCPGGPGEQRRRLEAEGHRFSKKGKSYRLESSDRR
jgi:alkylated DNA nucleotide flippase Atl1